MTTFNVTYLDSEGSVYNQLIEADDEEAARWEIFDEVCDYHNISQVLKVEEQ